MASLLRSLLKAPYHLTLNNKSPRKRFFITKLLKLFQFFQQSVGGITTSSNVSSIKQVVFRAKTQVNSECKQRVCSKMKLHDRCLHFLFLLICYNRSERQNFSRFPSVDRREWAQLFSVGLTELVSSHSFCVIGNFTFHKHLFFV